MRDFRQDARRRLQRARAGPEGARSPEAAARVQDAGLGLCRWARGRRSGRRRQGGDGARSRARSPVRKSNLAFRRSMLAAIWGVEFEFRPGDGQALARPVADDARLHGRSRQLFPLRIDGDAEDHRPRRRAGREAERLLGGRVRADAIHALDLPAPRGRRRRRRAARHCRFRLRTRSLRPRIISSNPAGAQGSPGASRSSCRKTIRARPGARPNNPCRSGRRTA